MESQLSEKHYSGFSENIGQYKGVLIFAEQHDGNIKECTFELLGEGRRLADELGEELGVILVGFEIKSLTESLFGYGADKVYLINDENLKYYQTEAYTTALAAAITKYKPSIVLFGATTTGLDLAPRIATRIQTGLVAHTVALNIEKGSRILLQTCPWLAGHMAIIKCPHHRPQICTVLPGTMSKPTFNPNLKGEAVELNIDIKREDIHTKVIEVIKDNDQSSGLEGAEIVVAGGRGVGSAENFRLIEELAKVLGGAVGASKAVVDAGWRPESCLIGQTGKTISPRLYIACGISGEIQHMVGVQKSDIIIAINKDSESPIFNMATYGIVGDLHQVVPLLIQELKGDSS